MKKIFLFAAALMASVSMFAANISCADAKAKIDANDKAEYTVEGYVTAIEVAPDPAYENISFWMDDKADGGKVFEVYRLSYKGKKAEDIPVVGDKVAVTATLKKYTPKSGDPIYETDVIKGYEILVKGSGKRYTDDDLNISEINVAQALEIGMALKNGEKTTKSYTVTGYVIKFAKNGEYNEQYKNQSFYMSDNASDSKSDFEAYRASIDAPGAKIGDKVAVTGFIERYDGSYTTIEISNGKAVIVEAGEGPDIPDLPEGVISCADAVKAAAAIADPQAEKETVKGDAVTVRGFVTFAYDAKDGKQSAWLNDDKNSKAGQLQGSFLKVDEAVAAGDYVELVGTLAKYKNAGKDGKEGEIIIEVIDGTMKKVDAQDIEVVVFEPVKAQKVMINGQMFIIRNGVKYNATGAVVE